MDFPDHTAQFHKREPAEIIEVTSGAVTRRWLAICMIPVAAACTAIGYGYQQRTRAKAMAAQAEELRASVSQLREQMKTLNTKISDVTRVQRAVPAQAPDDEDPNPLLDSDGPRRGGTRRFEVDTGESADPAMPASRGGAAGFALGMTTHRPPAKPRTPAMNTSVAPSSSDNSLQNLQALVKAQQKELAAMQDEMAKTRSDLQGNIESARDEAKVSIAKTHDEVVALANRGDRNYFEFDLAKSKQFERVGPLTLSLRKADTKHESYDLNLMVDDVELSKKHVNLYEPIWLHTESATEPVQVVVNAIEKDRVRGYVSAPKYGDLRRANAAKATGAAAGANVLQTTASPASASPSTSAPASTSPTLNQPNSNRLTKDKARLTDFFSSTWKIFTR